MMAVWILRPVDPNSAPWVPWFDRTFTIFISAETETRARELAASERYVTPKGKVWMDATLVSCGRLTDVLPDGVVGEDMADPDKVLDT